MFRAIKQKDGLTVGGRLSGNNYAFSPTKQCVFPTSASKVLHRITQQSVFSLTRSVASTCFGSKAEHTVRRDVIRRQNISLFMARFLDMNAPTFLFRPMSDRGISLVTELHFTEH